MPPHDATIQLADPRAPECRPLLERHLRYANAHSPPESVHALDLDGLTTPDISFWTITLNDAPNPLGCIALKRLDASHAEIKSMHVLEEARGNGLARALVQHVITEARARGATRLSLETGSMDAYLPARTLYASFGFTPCPPFANYREDPLSTCMTLEL